MVSEHTPLHKSESIAQKYNTTSKVYTLHILISWYKTENITRIEIVKCRMFDSIKNHV